MKCDTKYNSNKTISKGNILFVTIIYLSYEI